MTYEVVGQRYVSDEVGLRYPTELLILSVNGKMHKTTKNLDSESIKLESHHLLS